MKRILLASILLATTAHAAPPPRLRLVTVQAPNTLSAKDVRRLQEEMRKGYADLGIPVRLYPTARLRSVSYQSYPLITDRSAVLSQLRAAARRERLIPPGGMAHVLGPAVTDGTAYYSWGMASIYSYGTESAVSVSSSVTLNYSGGSGFWRSVNGALHETAHTMGAEHVTTPTIMNRDPLSLVTTGRLPWDRDSAFDLKSNYKAGYFRNGNF